MKKTILVVGGIILATVLGRFGWAYFQMKSDEAKVFNTPALVSTTAPEPTQINATAPTQIQSVSYGQMITAHVTTVQFGNTTAFKVTKYPPEAVSWTLRLDCPAGLFGKIQSLNSYGVLDQKTVNCNQDIALDKEPYSKYPQSVLFVMQFGSVGPDEQIVTIVSKTFDSAGAVLNQSSIPITVQGQKDELIKVTLSNSRTLAELYYDSNEKSYAGVCSNPNPFSYPPNTIISKQEGLIKNSDSIVCKDSKTAWSMSAQLNSSAPQYWCVDSVGNLLIRNSVITTTSCK